MLVWAADTPPELLPPNVKADLGRTRETTTRQERFYRTLVDQALDIVTVVTREGTIAFESQAIERILGYTTEELVGRNVFEFIHAEDLDRVRHSFAEAIETGQSQNVEFRFRHKDGSWRVFEAMGRTSTDLGDSPMGIVHSRDITERKRLEKRYRHAQKLEAIGRMTGAIAHDFNNLLTAILGHANMVLDTEESITTRASLVQILAATERATLFNQQLLRYARRDQADDDEGAPPVDVDVHEALAELKLMLKPLISKQTTMSLALGAANATVALDRGQLEQIVMNLAVNARDAMPAGGRLTIATRNVTRCYGRSGRTIDYFVLEVVDTGVGMAPDVRARVFEPFFTTKAPGKGTGLGLSTVFDIVQEANGHIELDSIEGYGTTFRVLLPIAGDRLS